MGRLRELIRSREPAAGNWVSIADASVAELSALLEFDFVLIDTEHTPSSLETVAGLIRGVESVDAATEAIVRVPSNDPARIKRVLDIGVGGIMVPLIETAGEAESFVRATRYPPDGIRGVASGRAADYGLDFEEAFRTANEDHVTVAQIENRAGIENAADIAAVEGLDALFIGPADLSASLDMFLEWDDEAFVDAVASVVEDAHASDTAVGILAVTAADIERWAAVGVDYMIVGVDKQYIVQGSRAAKETFESAMAARDD